MQSDGSKYGWYAIIITAFICIASPCVAGPFGLLGHKSSSEPKPSDVPQAMTSLNYGDREMLLYVPSRLPAEGMRALVIVLHGGGGNATRVANERSESALNMNKVAEKYGFIVAYLNGTRAMKRIGADALAWNAGGGCCGQPAKTNVDDKGYILGAAGYLADTYGVDRARIFGMGHSNGSMMTMRLMCETHLFAGALAISGPLNIQTDSCPAARGKRILAIHGAEDENVPLSGGEGTGPAKGPYKSEAYARQIFTGSDASYTLDVVEGADHTIDHLDAKIQQTDGMPISEKAARFFGLAH